MRSTQRQSPTIQFWKRKRRLWIIEMTESVTCTATSLQRMTGFHVYIKLIAESSWPHTSDATRINSATRASASVLSDVGSVCSQVVKVVTCSELTASRHLIWRTFTILSHPSIVHSAIIVDASARRCWKSQRSRRSWRSIFQDFNIQFTPYTLSYTGKVEIGKRSHLSVSLWWGNYIFINNKCCTLIKWPV